MTFDEPDKKSKSLTVFSMSSTVLLLPVTNGLTKVYIGRYPDHTPSVQIQAFNTKVSKEHAILMINGIQENVTVHCLSKNGLFVNNNFVDQDEIAQLNLNDRMYIGGSLYRFQVSNDFKQHNTIQSTLVPTSDDNLQSESNILAAFARKHTELSSELVDVVTIEDKENHRHPLYAKSALKQIVVPKTKNSKSVKFVDLPENMSQALQSQDLPSNTQIFEDLKENIDIPENLVDLVVEAIVLSGQSHLTAGAINNELTSRYQFGNLKSEIRQVVQSNDCFECRTDSGVTSKMWTYLPNLDEDFERGEMYSHCMTQMPQRRSKMGVKRYYFKPVLLPNEKKKRKMNNDDLDDYVV